MHNCLILGSGRSGTSMVAGTLSKAGYYMGDNLIPPREANPKGFFEDSFINRTINEAIMQPIVSTLKPGQYWLAALPKTTTFIATPVIAKHIQHAVSKIPFCYKDPRFSYTLSAWRPFLQNTKFVCVFRHPAENVTSLIKECNTAKYLRGIDMNPQKAFHIYETIYDIIIDVHAKHGDWLFVAFDQMLQPIGLQRLSKFLGVKVDASFPEQQFKRSRPTFLVPSKVLKLYTTLQHLSTI